MPNTFLTADAIATVTANLVGLDLNLAALISRDLESDFRGKRGATISVRVPGATPVNVEGIFDTTTPLVASSLNEQSIPVTLDDHVYSRVVLSEGDMDLTIQAFAAQVARPQARAIAGEVERRTVAALQSTPTTSGLPYDPTDAAKTFTRMRAKLRSNKVPDDAHLIAVAGVNVEADLLDGPAGTFDADGKVRGFEVHYSNRLAPGEIIAFIPEAFTLVVRAPEVPDGAPFGASIRTESEPGFALRWIRTFDGGLAVDNSLVSAFVEVTPMPLPVVNETAGTVALVANAGAVRFVPAA